MNSIAPSGSSVICAVIERVRVEAAHAAPGDVYDVGAGLTKMRPAGGRIEVGEERRHARRAGEQPRDVALGARDILFPERDVAVRVDERVGAGRAVEVKPKRAAPTQLSSSPSVSCRPSVLAEVAVDPPRVVAAGAVAA